MTNETREEEVWKIFPDYPFIEVSNLGRVRTKDRYVPNGKGKRLVKGRILKQYANKDGYMYVSSSVNGKNICLRVSRLVAICFLPNPNNYPEVNHIDCNRANNVVSNLEWCTSQYNTAYRDKLGHTAKHNAPKKPVIAVNLETGKVLHFESQAEAERHLGISNQRINDVLKGRNKTAGGYLFTENESEITEEKIQEIRANMPFSGGVIAIDPNTFEVFRFESQSQAARQLGVDYSHINAVTRGQRKTTGGYYFCYADKNAVEKVREKFGDALASEVEKLMV